MMLKLATRLPLFYYQRPEPCNVIWKKMLNSRGGHIHNQLGNHRSRKVPSILCNSYALHNIPVNVSQLCFHTSTPRKALPPVLVVLMRPLMKFVAIVFGRTIRLWWKELPPVQKQSFIKALRQRKYLYFALLTPVPAGAVYFYTSHIDETPVTGRKRFIAFSKERIVQLAEIEQEVFAEEHGRAFLPHNHPAYQRVLRVITRLLDSNEDVEGIKEPNWRVVVVDDKEIPNAFVLPNGTIFVYTGMLLACANDNQLSIVLAHEMAHAILRHTAEQLSNVHLIECLLFLPVVVMWAVLPYVGAFIVQWFSGVIAKMLLHLPFSRQTEMEADDVGLTLAAKACFDVREAPCFWKKMKAMTNDDVDEWLSTHPSYETRQSFLDKLMPSALKVRETCQCPKLSSQDPRLSIDSVIQLITQTRILEKQLHSKT